MAITTWLSLVIIILLGSIWHTLAFPLNDEEDLDYDSNMKQIIPEFSLQQEDYNIPAEWLNLKSQQEKRGPCHGTACIYSHIAAKAGNSSLRRLKLTLLRECIDDPLCFAAGRRKRSTARKRKTWAIKSRQGRPQRTRMTP